MKDLYHKIEGLRRKMHVIALAKGISHPEVLMASQRLDEAINELFELAKLDG